MKVVPRLSGECIAIELAEGILVVPGGMLVITLSSTDDHDVAAYTMEEFQRYYKEAPKLLPAPEMSTPLVPGKPRIRTMRGMKGTGSSGYDRTLMTLADGHDHTMQHMSKEGQLNINTCSARITELQRDGLLDRRSEIRRGVTVAIMHVTPAGLEYLKRIQEKKNGAP